MEPPPPADARPALDDVIAAMPGWADAPDLAVRPLEGGITNRNFLVRARGESFVARLPGRDTDALDIDRAAEASAAREAAGAGVGPEVVAFLPQRACLVTRFVAGEAIPPEHMQRPEVLSEIADSLRRFHSVAPIPASFSPFRIVRRYAERARARGVEVPEEYGQLLARADEIEAAFSETPVAARPCHNDLLNANFIRGEESLFIVDYEYAGMGDLFFDLGNLSVNNAFSEEADEALVRLYFGDATPARLARLKLMRIMSDFREAMWGVIQQGLSTLDFDYRAYARRHFDRCRDQVQDPRYGVWLHDARERV